MNNRFLNYRALDFDTATLLLRLVFGGLFIFHGYQKIQGYDQFVGMFDIIGIGSKLSLILVIFAEFFCGILVTVGLFTRLAVIPIFITMVVAYFVAHGKDTFDKKELPFLFMILAIVIFFTGSGRYSLDRVLQNRRGNTSN